MYKLFLTFRYLRKRRIAVFAIASVWLCVAMEVIVISVMGGFLDTLKERSRGLLSDIIVSNRSLQGFPYYQEFIDHLVTTMPETVVAATPVINNYGILRIEGTSYTKPVAVVGIRLSDYEAVNDFHNSLYYDKYYPGTTTLGPQRIPALGYDDLTLRLPDDHVKAHNRWKAENPDAEEIDDWRLRPGSGHAGPGKFEYTFNVPGYYGDEAPGIIVGCSIINERTKAGKYERIYPRGSKIILTVIPLTMGGNLAGGGATTVALRLADDSLTGVYEIDNLHSYVDFDLLQEWLGMSPQERVDGGFTPAQASQVLIRLAEGVDYKQACPEIQTQWDTFLESLNVPPDTLEAELLSYVSVETWEDRQIQFIAAVEKEKILVTLLFGIISLVAVVLIGCIFWMIVVQKTRDIGIIKSVGASASGVATIFVAFGAVVGVLGATLGAVSGATFVWYINDIQDWLVSIHPQLQVWSPDVYTFDRIPNAVKWHEVAIISMVAVFASVVGALIPAVLAGRVWPVKALRYE